MLILTRKKGQSIVIADDIIVTVIDSSGDQVRIGVDAPRHISVHREEVYSQITTENAAARSNEADDLIRPATGARLGALPTRPSRNTRRLD